MSDTKKSVNIQSDWRRYRYHILVGILLAPLVVGLVILFLVWLKIRSNEYHIFDDHIYIPADQVKIDLANIYDIRLSNQVSFMNAQLADIEIKTPDSSYTLPGIIDAQMIQDAILLAVKGKINQKKKLDDRNAIQIKADPGTLERLNDLAGLLQEGLISYEDYLEERKKFDQ